MLRKMRWTMVMLRKMRWTRMMLKMMMPRLRHAPRFVQACAVEMHIRAILCRYLQVKCRTPRPRHMLCASRSSRNAHGHVARAVLGRDLQRSRNAHGRHKSNFLQEFTGKTPQTKTAPQSTCTWTCHMSNFLPEFTGKMPQTTRPTFWASLHNQNAHGHVTRAILCRKSHGKGRRPIASKTHGADFARACAVETHMNISQASNFYTKIYRENAGAQSEHPDQAPALTPTSRTPRCGHTVWGNIVIRWPGVGFLPINKD